MAAMPSSLHSDEEIDSQPLSDDDDDGGGFIDNDQAIAQYYQMADTTTTTTTTTSSSSSSSGTSTPAATTTNSSSGSSMQRSGSILLDMTHEFAAVFGLTAEQSGLVDDDDYGGCYDLGDVQLEQIELDAKFAMELQRLEEAEVVAERKRQMEDMKLALLLSKHEGDELPVQDLHADTTPASIATLTSSAPTTTTTATSSASPASTSTAEHRALLVSSWDGVSLETLDADAALALKLQQEEEEEQRNAQDLEYARKLAAEWETPEFTDEGTIEQLAATILKSIHKERVQCSKVERIRSQVLETKFEVKWEELKATYGAESALAKPRLAFHGTSAANIDSISTRGLLVPGTAAGVKHATDNGYYGKGIYLSPSYQLSAGYCRNNGKLLACAVLMGNSFSIMSHDMSYRGRGCKAGFDSHISAKEWVVFSAAQILPIFWITPGGTRRPIASIAPHIEHVPVYGEADPGAPPHVMSVAGLRRELATRKISTAGKNRAEMCQLLIEARRVANEVQAVIKSIEEKDKEERRVLDRVNYKQKPASMTVKQLQKELKKRGLDVDGLKAELVARVAAARQVEGEVVREYERLLKEENQPARPAGAPAATVSTTTSTSLSIPSKRTASSASIDEPPAKRSAIQLSVLFDD